MTEFLDGQKQDAAADGFAGADELLPFS